MRGINLSKQLTSVAGRTLKANITKLAPQILPLSEKLAYISNLIARKVLSSAHAISHRLAQGPGCHRCMHWLGDLACVLLLLLLQHSNMRSNIVAASASSCRPVPLQPTV